LRVLGPQIQYGLKKGWFPFIVRIQESDKFATGLFDTSVSCRRRSLVLLPEQLDSMILDVFYDSVSAVRGTIIDYDNLMTRNRLVQS
jgi:hypothetical protein